jgi:hypothetical protein
MEKGIQIPMAQGRSTTIISMIKCILTSRLSMTNSLSLSQRALGQTPKHLQSVRHWQSVHNSTLNHDRVSTRSCLASRLRLDQRIRIRLHPRIRYPNAGHSASRAHGKKRHREEREYLARKAGAGPAHALVSSSWARLDTTGGRSSASASSHVDAQ